MAREQLKGMIDQAGRNVILEEANVIARRLYGPQWKGGDPGSHAFDLAREQRREAFNPLRAALKKVLK